jgi:hypothetical protein
MNDKKIVEKSEQLVDAAFSLKELMSSHKNAFKWDTHFGDDRDGKDYRVTMVIEQVVLTADKTEVKYIVPPRLKDNIN